MVSVSDVIAQTGMDFKDPKLTELVLAPAVGKRLSRVIPQFADATSTITSMMQIAGSIGAATTVAGAIGAMVGAVKGAQKWLDGRVEASYSKTLQASEDAREGFVQTYYQPGAWSSVLSSSKSPSPAALNIKGGTGQYDKYFVFSADRAVGQDRIVPTWRTPPYDSAAGTPDQWGDAAWPPMTARAMDWEKQKWPAPPTAPLSGHRGVKKTPISPARAFVDVQPPVPVIPAKYRDKYWGGAPGNDTKDFANKYDTTLFLDGMGIPPGYEYLFSWGTYPYMAWSTNSEGLHNGVGKLDFSRAAAAVHAAIHSISALHVRIDAQDVARCYANWTLVSGIRNLPRIPVGQILNGVYLDVDDFPWAPSEWGVVPQPLCDGKPPSLEGWKSGIWWTANDPTCPSGLNSKPGFFQIPWQVAKDIEKAFRSFFKLRRAILFQWSSVSEEIRKAAAVGADFYLSSLAAGVPIADLVAAADGRGLLSTNWTEANPLGWSSSKEFEGVLQGVPADVPGLGFKQPSSGSNFGAFVGVAGAAALVRWLTKRKSW